MSSINRRVLEWMAQGLVAARGEAEGTWAFANVGPQVVRKALWATILGVPGESSERLTGRLPDGALGCPRVACAPGEGPVVPGDSTSDDPWSCWLAILAAAVAAADLGDWLRASALEVEAAVIGRRIDDAYLRAYVRLMRARRLIDEGHVEPASRLLRRARSIIDSRQGRRDDADLLDSRHAYERARLARSQEVPDALWALLHSRNDRGLPPPLRAAAAHRAAELLDEHGQPASALALRLDLLENDVVRCTDEDRPRLLIDIAGAFFAADVDEDGLGFARDALATASATDQFEAIVTAQALIAIFEARLGIVEAARRSCELAARALESSGRQDSELTAIVALAEVLHLVATDHVADAHEVASKRLSTLVATPRHSMWVARLAIERMRLSARLSVDGVPSIGATQEAIFRTAQIRDLDGLREAHLASALVNVRSSGDLVSALDSLREARILTRTIASAARDDRKRAFELAPHDIVVRAIGSALAGRLAGLAEVVQDQLHEVAAELALQLGEATTTVGQLTLSRRRMARLLDTLPVVAWSAYGRARGFACRHVEGAVREVFGVDGQELVSEGRNWLDRVHEDDRDMVRSLLAAVERTFDGRRIEFRILKGESDVCHVELHAMPMLGESTEDGMLHGILTDVSERRRLHDELRQMQKMEAVGRLIDSVSHDFNNLLGSILGAATLLTSTMAHEDENFDVAEIIEQAAHRGTEMISRLRALARVESQSPVVSDISLLVRETAEMARSLIGGNYEIQCTGATVSIWSPIVPAAVTQALLNLIINAADAQPKDGRIRLHVEHESDDDLVAIHVIDAGEGMNTDVVERALDPFFSTRGNDRRRGLGLTTVYRVARDLGGDLKIRSQVGEGTNIRLRLPATDGPQVEARDASTDGLPTSLFGGRLLLIDDDPQILLVAERILRKAGFEVTCARDGREGIATFERYRGDWALVVCDVRMPGQDGMAVVRHIRGGGTTPPILLMTGHAEREPVDVCRDIPAVGLIRKPFTAAAFATEARRTLNVVL